MHNYTVSNVGDHTKRDTPRTWRGHGQLAKWRWDSKGRREWRPTKVWERGSEEREEEREEEE
eukprot:SAG31_NODE_26582_length_440_cov_0.554252_1_plen_61_part_01